MSSTPTSDLDVGVVVLGMHRSGTSAVTSAFAASGYFVGLESERLEANRHNPNGHWENNRILHAHEDLLGRIGGSWFDPPPAAAQLAAAEWALPTLRTEVRSIVTAAGAAPVAIKDPRIGGLLPLWREIIADGLHPVLVVRDPLEVARSLHARDRMPQAFALASWELHLGALIEFLDGQEVTVAPYGPLLADPALAARLVTEASARMSDERVARLRPDRAGEALEVHDRHNHAQEGEHEEWLTARQSELWRWLEQLPAGRQLLEVPAKLRVGRAAARSGARQETERTSLIRDVRELRTRASELERQVAGESEAHRAAAARASEMEAELNAARGEAMAARVAERRAEAVYEALLNSVSWRLTRPLRVAKAILAVTRDRRR